MNFQLTEERQMLQDGLRRYLGDAVTPAALAAAEATGSSPEIWAGLSEMGVAGALFTEDQGGFGGMGFDLMTVFEELGRSGATEPMLELLLAGGLVAELGTEAQKGLIEQAVEGSVQLAFAHGEPASRFDVERVETRAERSDEGWSLTGRKSVVANGAQADHIVISARTSGEARDRDGISLFLLPKGTAGVETRDYPLSHGGHAAEITLDGVSLPESALLGAEGAAIEAIETAQARATAALCADALGAMETARGLTGDYLKTRKQFGQPIGKFQALQHRAADMLIEIEQARSAVINLCGHLEADRDTREIHVSATKHLVGKVARLVAEEAIQMHGGIGMTEEYDLGRFARRLSMLDQRFGDATFHLGRFVRLRAA
ncbi:acyl-CoA dehydrogenase family protein [Limimaricola sp. G21655-S1]|uniref:acyl-CoA dehydrogenase family protein n=1 Tax=Limimaricola sp. G21655-S1 TaxID=3014768 RepID=UPI0022AE74D8|nr:acyl-CoA dehydrogenase family protein [Limimaricola sp. G21655-S1]MCZ4259705.1 acyl-CoA dehydrogenase family protein [Limimaricola sp. G21655-S1]